jgi:hypothetical protein
LALKELIDKELDRMIEDKVLNQIETSEWGTSLVPIRKNDGTVRLCGDYKTTVNSYFPVLRERTHVVFISMANFI